MGVGVHGGVGACGRVMCMGGWRIWQRWGKVGLVSGPAWGEVLAHRPNRNLCLTPSQLYMAHLDLCQQLPFSREYFGSLICKCSKARESLCRRSLHLLEPNTVLRQWKLVKPPCSSPSVMWSWGSLSLPCPFLASQRNLYMNWRPWPPSLSTNASVYHVDLVEPIIWFWNWVY